MLRIEDGKPYSLFGPTAPPIEAIEAEPIAEASEPYLSIGHHPALWRHRLEHGLFKVRREAKGTTL